MADITFTSLHKLWQKVGQHKKPSDYALELALYKKIIDIFQIGDYYHFIFVPPTSSIELLSPNIEKILGHTLETFSPSFFLESIHPQDLPQFIAFENAVVNFKMQLPLEKIMKYKTQYNYRIRKKDGSYLPILQQSVTIQCDKFGAILRNLVIHTDISDFKKDNKMNLSFIGLEGEPSFLNYQIPHNISTKKPLLTKREKEILNLIAQNKTTLEIAQQLFISPATVSTHRKNIHAKTGTKNILQLVTQALEKSWLSLFLFFSPWQNINSILEFI